MRQWLNFHFFRISTQIIKTPTQFQHVICLATGMLSLHMLFSSTFYYIILLIILSYILLFISTYFQYVKHRGALIVLSSLVFLVVCELWLVEPKQWHRIRGPQMIVVMKSVSLAFDLDIGTVKEIPNLVYYSGLFQSLGIHSESAWMQLNFFFQGTCCVQEHACLDRGHLITIICRFIDSRSGISGGWEEYSIALD